ncbi:hypothetical protein C9J40_00670 [Photobacterium sp. GB-72]|nr:hypothetical protein C9J40_00670 [Photobacterium sp. GB-72]
MEIKEMATKQGSYPCLRIIVACGHNKKQLQAQFFRYRKVCNKDRKVVCPEAFVALHWHQ